MRTGRLAAGHVLRRDRRSIKDEKRRAAGSSRSLILDRDVAAEMCACTCVPDTPDHGYHIVHGCTVSHGVLWARVIT